jgi:hypothetical protein
MLEKLEFVFDVVRGEHGAVGQLAHILGAVDDLQVAIGVEKPGVAGHEITLGIDRFGGGVGALVVFLEQHRPLDQHLAVVGNLDLDAGRRQPDRIGLDRPIRLQTDVGAGFGLAVELLEVDADGAVEAEQIGADRGPGGVGHPECGSCPAHCAAGRRPADYPIHRAADRSDRHRFAVEQICATAAFGHAQKIMEHPALDGRRHPPCGS